MAGTNDLSNRKVSPDDLIKSTDEYLLFINRVCFSYSKRLRPRS